MTTLNPQDSVSSSPSFQCIAKRENAKVLTLGDGTDLVRVKVGMGGIDKGEAMIDGGSQENLIKLSSAKQLLPEGHFSPVDDVILMDVQGKEISTYGQGPVQFKIGDQEYTDKFVVVKTLPSDMLIGRPFLKNHKVEVHHGNEKLKIGSSGCEVPFIKKEETVPVGTIALVLSKDVLIPPQKATRVKIYSKRRLPTTIFEIDNVDGLPNGVEMVKEAMIPKERCCYIKIINKNERRVVLPKTAVKVTMTKVDMAMNEVVPLVNLVSANHSTTTTTCNSTTTRKLPPGETEEDIRKLLSQVKIGHCDAPTREKIMALLWKYNSLFSRDKWDIGRVTTGFKHTVRLKPDAKAKSFAPYRSSPSDRAIEKRLIEKMKKADLIRDSRSPWAMPLMLIKKPDDPTERRPVINCKYLNSQQQEEATFLPRCDDLLDKFGGKKYISKLDCCQFYFQIPLDEKSQDVCSFSTNLGNFSSKVTLQGDMSAPADAQRLLMDVLKEIEDCFCLIDDIGLTSTTLEGHLRDLERIFKRLMEIGVTLRPDKLEILADELTYLGFKLIKGGKMLVTDDKVARVREWPRCRTPSEIRTFLGLAGFLRKFVRGFSQIARPLIELTKKERLQPEDWSEEVDKSFKALKQAITTAPCLTIPDPLKGTLHLYTDAAKDSIGWVLAQELQENGKTVLKPCAFGSRLFRGSEKSFTIPEKEILAAVWSMKKNHHYLFGKVFKLHTDSSIAYHVLRNPTAEGLTSRLFRFAVEALPYSFQIHQVKSEKNWADPLSRLPLVIDPTTGELEYNKDEIVIDDPLPPPLEANVVDIDPLWISPVTRAQARDEQVGPGLLQEQVQDEDISKLRREVEEDEDKKVKRGKLTFVMDNGILKARDKKRRLRIVVPKSMVKGLLDREHSIGHFGAEKMLASLTRKYYWKDMASVVRNYVKTCFTCQTNKGGQQNMIPLGDLPRPAHQQEILGLDVKGPLPQSHGKRYILVCMDLLTRYAYTKAVAHVDGRAVVDFLLEDVFKMGVCSMLITDNAPNLKDGLAGYMYKELGIDNRNSIPYLASSNGAIERCIGSLSRMLRCAAEDNPSQWSKLLPTLTTEYNFSIHRATRISPFHFHFGYVPRKITDINPPDQKIPFNSIDRYMDAFKKKRDEVQRNVQEGLKRYYSDMKQDFKDAHNVQRSKFYIGQWVLARNLAPAVGQSKSLRPLFEGPAEIMKLLPSSAEIMFIKNGIRRLRSLTHLKPYYSRPDEEELEEVQPRYTGPRRGAVQESEDQVEDGILDVPDVDDDDHDVDHGPDLVAPVSSQNNEEDEEDIVRQVSFAPDVQDE